jgi:iron complex outermembrane receptor protein
VFVNEDAPLKNVVPGFVESCKRSEPFSIATNVHGISDVQSMGVWGGLDWDLGQVGPVDLSLRTLGSWRQQLPRINEDLDSTPQEVIKISSIGDPPFNGFPGFQQQWSYEFQVNGSTWQDRINLVSGVFAFWENGRFEPTILAGPQATPLDVNLSRTSIDNWTWALFAQGTADIWDWLSVTGGLRFTQDKKGLSVFNRDPRFPLNPAELQGDESKVYDRWTPMGSIVLRPPQPWLDSTPIERGMFYFTYAKGFKGGGFNGVLGAGTDELTTFLPEKLDNFEIGFKTTSFDDRLTLNLALFYGIYNDVQVITIQSFEDPTNPAVGSRTERVTQNADGTIQGIEVEAHAMPIDNLEMIGSFGYVDATYDDFENASDELAFCLQATPIEQCQRDRSGESFDRVPRMQASVAVQYSYAVDLDGPDWLDGYFVPRVDWSYRSDYHLLSRQIEAAIQHGYHLLGARFAYEFLDDRRAYVALWAKNLTDESYFTEATPITGTFGSTTRYFQWPRTFGLEASYRFQ